MEEEPYSPRSQQRWWAAWDTASHWPRGAVDKALQTQGAQYKNRQVGVVCCEGYQGTWAGEDGSLIMSGLGCCPRILMSPAGSKGPINNLLEDNRAAVNRDESGARCAGPPPGSLQ